ncbi:MAG: LysR family transcriptional regulator [Deinococcus sp.]|nr:LysR family transcriptional regulator [Deinococcus sp.]
MEPRSKFWIEHQSRYLIGPRLVQLLEAVDRLGSLRQAAAELGWSYRYAWGRVQQLAALLDQPVLASSAGGPGGGGSRLTAAGQELLERYQQFEAGLKEQVRQRFNQVFGNYTLAHSERPRDHRPSRRR